ncbi:PP2C family protein-serine/threonine phosphatase [Kitasatospora paracochleata]|uniref:Serine phosphatase RsbU (Regulator of sigma subunit) n=1 Tax=Kitasatospora paracochleata TaxID=58354 RepID=A0ABT1IV72_9ACTN|nr:PP2C family protein-serine/threonine phosphatase [Kitasatospora paracochleata]MCP2308989.1 serine phosphatase RsbU (regulator of sigma subunit) [Kitasatospora paracochleata]
MGFRAPALHNEEPWRRKTALVLIPLALIVVIVVIDLRSPTSIHLGPLLVIAPALTASFGGPLLAGLIGALAVLAQVLIAGLHGGLTTSNHLAQIAALTVLSALIVAFTAVREHRAKQLARAQSVAEAAQRALLRPLPEQIGPLQIATLYLAADDETQIGGDLYTATRAGSSTRMIIGDVRGKGLAAVGESALLVSAFRLIAPQYRQLPDLAATLDRNVGRYLVDFAEVGGDTPEHFITALLLDLPDGEGLAHLTNCGHPPPLLLLDGQAVPVDLGPSAPPLGVHGLGDGHYPCDTFPFEEGATLLLYTDGVTEARDRAGNFYPLAERAARWTRCTPESLVHHLHRDLLAHVGHRLGDDAAVIAIRRTETPPLPDPTPH